MQSAQAWQGLADGHDEMWNRVCNRRIPGGFIAATWPRRGYSYLVSSRWPLAPPGHRGDFDILAFLAPAQDFDRQNRMIEALQAYIVERRGFDPLLDHSIDAPGDHDLAGFRLVA